MITILDYARLSNAVYSDSPNVRGWALVGQRTQMPSGLIAGVFTKGRKTVVAFKGTTPSETRDLQADLALGVGINTDYFADAETFVQQHANVEGLVATGHSLGGAVAQVVGNRRRIPFVTFNAPGVAIISSRHAWTATPHMAAIRVIGGLASAIADPGQAARDAASLFHIANGKNYRFFGDPVSAIGLHYGDVISLMGYGVNQHSMDLMEETLAQHSYGSINFPT